MKKLFNMFQNEDGQALAEYALVVGLIAVACVAMVTGVGTGINGMLTKVSNALQ
jgi:pilus assembly protein Flp/PilA